MTEDIREQINGTAEHIKRESIDMFINNVSYYNMHNSICIQSADMDSIQQSQDARNTMSSRIFQNI